jgi:hypothetical protein
VTGKISVVVHTCRITCNGCGRVADHPGSLTWTVTNSVMYADGKCPVCGSDDIVGEDLEGETTIEVGPQAQDWATTLAALATYVKEATHG